MWKRSKEFFSVLLFFIFSSLNILSSEKRYNILLITVDTLRPDRLSCYNKAYLQTPNIDELAQKGILFKRAFAHNPTTLPSHANILTGVTPLFHGIHDNSHFKLDDKFLTISEFLKKEGYSTGAFVGAFPLDSRFGLDQGFDVYDDSYPSKPKIRYVFPERKAEKVVENAIAWLKEQKGKWFAWVHLFDPHQPYLPPEPFFSKFKNDPYSGEVAYIDFEIGNLLRFLKENGSFEKTIVLLTADHGESLGEHGESTHGYFAYNSTLWVPLIFYIPGMNQKIIDDYVSHVDIFPTICDLLKIKKLSFLQGVSLLPLLEGKKLKERAIYFESLHAYYNRGWAPLRGIIEKKYKYIDSPVPELYNLEKDFNEKINLASKTNLDEYKERLKEMEESFSNLKNESISRIDRETQERLKSLGYISPAIPHLRKGYGREDDLKTLLPIHNKFQEAIVFFERGEIDNAISILKDVVAKRKDFDLAFCRLAEMLIFSGKKNEAIKIMSEGYESNPDNHSILSTYGIILVESGKIEEAIPILLKGVDLFSFDPELWNYLGIAYWRKGEVSKTIEAYEKALALDKNYAIVYNNLGSLYLSIFIKNPRREFSEKALIFFKKAIELDSELPTAYNGLGSLYKKLGRVEDAIYSWEKALEFDPNFDFPAYNLGITYLEKGEKRRALKYLQLYLKIKNKNISVEEREKIEALIQKCK